MPLTAAQLKAGIPGEIGDTGVAAALLDNTWTKHDDKSLYLQYLYTKRDLIDALKGSVWEDVTIHSASSARLMLEQKFTNLTRMREEVEAEIVGYARRRRKPKVGVMTATAPVMSPAGYADANSGVYRGDPNTRSRCLP